MIRHKILLLKLRLIVAVSLLLAGCDPSVTLATRSMTDPLPTVTIPGAAIPSELTLLLDLAIDSEILGVEADSRFLTFARIRNLRLNILNISENDNLEDGAEDSFDFLFGLTVAIRATIDGIEQEEIVAFLPDGDPQIGSAARALDLTVVDLDVLDYLQAAGGYELVLAITGVVPPDAVILGGDVRYRIGVGLF